MTLDRMAGSSCLMPEVTLCDPDCGASDTVSKSRAIWSRIALANSGGTALPTSLICV
jgi:hypothetical protein